MFERFTERAIKVIILAKEEAHKLKHKFVGSEHFLIGLLSDNNSSTAMFLKASGIDLKEARAKIEEIHGRGSGTISAEIPFSEHATKIMNQSWEESKALGQNHIGPEHLLLAILGTGKEATGGNVIASFGINLTFPQFNGQ